MKKLLDWEQPEVVNIWDEASLWSAPFGRLLLENIPMWKQANVLDIGFGTGFPLVELSQRFGEGSKIVGIDIWPAAIERTKEKIRMLGLQNIEIIAQSANSIDLPDESIDLVTSCLGVNNFEAREEVYSEVFRVLKPAGRLCITTNPIGTFRELFQIFEQVLMAMNLQDQVKVLQQYIDARNTKEQIVDEITAHGFTLEESKTDQTNMRFVDASALLNHSLIRIGFRSTWEDWFSEDQRSNFFEQLIAQLEKRIEESGVFEMVIPMLYLEFGKSPI